MNQRKHTLTQINDQLGAGNGKLAFLRRKKGEVDHHIRDLRNAAGAPPPVTAPRLKSEQPKPEPIPWDVRTDKLIG